MVLRPLALFLVTRAFHPRVDFRAGKERCLAMCQLGCSTNPNNKASSCVEISDMSGVPWADPFISPDQETFKYKWCRIKYQIAIVATRPVERGFFQTIKYPKTGLDSGEFAEVDHLEWIAPACNRTTASSCRSIGTRNSSVDELDHWLTDEGNDCRNLVDEQICTDDCSKVCVEWCNCGWGENARIAYEAGMMRRYGYEAIGGNQTCFEAYAFDKECTCSHGSAADSKVCSFHGREQCVACAPGFTLQNISKTCQPNECVCDNGIPVDSAMCSTHRANECSKCTGNYHLDQGNRKHCQANVCKCLHGAPVFGMICTTHDANKCLSCTDGYHLSNQACAANVCNCLHGAPVTGTICTTHDANKCFLCTDGYHLSNQTCAANECKCLHGTPVASTMCTTHGANQCSSCTQGFRLLNQACAANVCNCHHGTPVTGTTCTRHGANKCRSCTRTYHLSNHACTANVCNCLHGAPVTGTICTTHDANKCLSCTDGYHLSNQTCAANECKCLHGTPVTGTMCTTHDANQCSSCTQEGFRLLNQACAANVCKCLHGTPVIGTACTRHGANKCLSCTGAYHLSNQACIEYNVTSIAGGTVGFANGHKDKAKFRINGGITVASDGSIYVADSQNHLIRRISRNGTVSTLAGSGQFGFDDGAAESAKFSFPTGVAIDNDGNLYVADKLNARIRRINITTLKVTTAAASIMLYSFIPNEVLQSADLERPIDLAVDVRTGDVYVVDVKTHRILRISISNNQLETVAGNGESGFLNGNALNAMFDSPEAIALHRDDVIYIADTKNHCIRRIDRTSNHSLVSTFAGTGIKGYKDGPRDQAEFDTPTGIAVDDERFVYVSDYGNNRIRRVSPRGTVITLAGTGEQGSLNGYAMDATFSLPYRVTVADGNLYIAEYSGIRRIQLRRSW